MIYVVPGFSPNMLPRSGLSVDFLPVDPEHVKARLRSQHRICANIQKPHNRSLFTMLAQDTGVVARPSAREDVTLAEGDVVVILIYDPTTNGIRYWEAYCYSLAETEEQIP